MATITLHKSEFDGIGSILDKLCSCFGNYDSTIKDLKRTASAVDSTTCDLTEVIDDIANSEESKEEKVKKAKALNQKIETFVNSAVKHENDAAEEIKKKKEDFYKTYKYLKPDCEKLFGKVGAFFENLGKAIGKWISENLIAAIIATLIVIAAIVVVILCPASVCAIIAVIVSCASALMGVGDIICTIATGKDFAKWLKDKGFPVLSQIYKGVGLGLDIASLILPLGAAKETLKESLKTPFKSLAKSIHAGKDKTKLFFNSIKNAFKNGGVLNGLKSLGKAGGNFVLNGLKDFVGFDDIKNGLQLGGAFIKGQRGKELSNTAMKLLGLGGLPDFGNNRNLDDGRYFDIVDHNSADLNNIVTPGQHGERNAAFAELEFGYDPSDPTKAAALSDLRAGNTSSSRDVYNDMRESFYQSLQTDSTLATDLLENTGVNISECANSSELKTALRNNGFQLQSNINGPNGAQVQIVPSWASQVTNSDGATMRIIDAHHASDSQMASVVRDYNTFINNKSNLFIQQHLLDVPNHFKDEALDALGNYTGSTNNKYDIVEDFIHVSPQTNPVVQMVEALMGL